MGHESTEEEVGHCCTNAINRIKQMFHNAGTKVKEMFASLLSDEYPYSMKDSWAQTPHPDLTPEQHQAFVNGIYDDYRELFPDKLPDNYHVPDSRPRYTLYLKDPNVRPVSQKTRRLSPEER